jgi:hypothetical protein
MSKAWRNNKAWTIKSTKRNIITLINPNPFYRIGDAFRKKFGDKAGWAHQILFAGDLLSFKEKVDVSKKRKIGETDIEQSIIDTLSTADSKQTKKRKMNPKWLL